MGGTNARCEYTGVSVELAAQVPQDQPRGEDLDPRLIRDPLRIPRNRPYGSCAKVIRSIIGLPRPSPLLHYVKASLLEVWYARESICSKHVVPLIPERVVVLKRHGELRSQPGTERLPLERSPAPIDRVLRTHRPKSGHGRSTTKLGTLLKILFHITGNGIQALKLQKVFVRRADRGRTPAWANS